MPSKQIIILANSVKKSAKCVAGIDVGTGKDLTPNGWIRPVSGESEGELKPHHMRVEGGGALKVFDIVNVPLTAHAQDAIHPEDWIVDSSMRWTRTGELDPATVDALEEQPKDLWLEPGKGSDRVSGSFLSKRPKHQSLYLIRPKNFRVELSVRQFFDNPNPTSRRRARFSYRGQDYEMNLTDPVFNETYCGKMPKVGTPTKTVQPPHGDNCLLCVSLTPLFLYHHWKVVATVLELP